MSSAANDRDKCARCAKILVYQSMAEAVVFIVLKVGLGLACGSRALLAASLYSLQDLIGSMVAAVGMKISVGPPDRGHPYGHGKVEYLVVALTGFLLILGIFALVLAALAGSLVAPGKPPDLLALWVAFLSGAFCWLSTKSLACAARKLNSPALRSCSQHFSGDMMSSVAVMASVVGARLGYPALDDIIATGEAVHIVFLAGCMVGAAINGLMDTSVPPDLLQRLNRAVEEVGPVMRVRDLRARWAGQMLVANVSVEVDGQVRVAEADDLCARIEEAIRTQDGGDRKALVQVALFPGPPPPPLT